MYLNDAELKKKVSLENSEVKRDIGQITVHKHT